MSEKYLGIILLAAGCFWAACVSTKTPSAGPTSPAIVDTKPTSVAGEQDAHELVAPSKTQVIAIAEPAEETSGSAFEVTAHTPQPSPPVVAKSATTQPVYQMPRRRLFGRFRR